MRLFTPGSIRFPNMYIVILLTEKDICSHNTFQLMENELCTQLSVKQNRELLYHSLIVYINIAIILLICWFLVYYESPPPECKLRVKRL